MLLQNEFRDVSSSGVMQVARATIKATPKIFNFFSDQTYANKPRAICRELAANAVDSHVMAGQPDLPIEVWLPTLLDPVFRVRDHGLGMSHEFMMTSFMAYADGSTKDGSNLAIGGFGIGSKSPFAYVDQYTITSKFDGTISVYSVFKDEEGIPSIGLLGQQPTTEANGVEVSFPVSQDDFPTFEAAAFEALRYFKPLPDIKNAQQGSFELPDYLSEGAMWSMRPQSGDLALIMGGVRYPVNTSSLTYKFAEDSPARKLLNYGLDLRVPIGTCSVALSREALSYDDRTIEAIKTSCEAVIDEVAEAFGEMFDHITSPWDARVALYKEVGPNSYSERGKFLAEHAKWQGEPFEAGMEVPMLGSRIGQWGEEKGQSFPCYGYELWTIDGSDDRCTRRGRTKPVGASKFENPLKYRLTPGAVEHLIIDDLPQLPKHKAIKKIKEFANDNGGRIIVLRADSDQVIDIEDFTIGFGSPGDGVVVLTSELPEPESDRSFTRAKNVNRPRVRMFTYDGSQQKNNYGSWNKGSNINPGQFGKLGVDEVLYEFQPDSGILVVMDKFDLPAGLHDAIESGLLSWYELRFVNQGDAKKLKKQAWVGFQAEFETRKKVAIAAYPELAARMAVATENRFTTCFDFFRRHPGTDFTSGKPLGRIFKIYKEFVEPLNEEQRKLSRFVTAKLPGRIKPAELSEKFKTQQWKAARLMGALSHTMDVSDMKLFQENL